ncbi:hypothetical protein [Microcoleus sp. B3-D7]|uniref:hypothetical protein n=1 Tax=Microcoleus sp. B3-D7 TaxID=2818659 RepID=UPI002FCEB64A
MATTASSKSQAEAEIISFNAKIACTNWSKALSSDAAQHRRLEAIAVSKNELLRAIAFIIL